MELGMPVFASANSCVPFFTNALIVVLARPFEAEIQLRPPLSDRYMPSVVPRKRSDPSERTACIVELPKPVLASVHTVPLSDDIKRPLPSVPARRSVPLRPRQLMNPAYGPFAELHCASTAATARNRNTGIRTR